MYVGKKQKQKQKQTNKQTNKQKTETSRGRKSLCHAKVFQPERACPGFHNFSDYEVSTCTPP